MGLLNFKGSTACIFLISVMILGIQLPSLYFSSVATIEISDTYSSEEVPHTKEELEQLMSKLSDISPEKEAEIKDNLKIPFSGFLKNEGQNSIEEIQYYYSSKDSFIGFSNSKIYFSQSTFEDDESRESIAFDLTFPGSTEVSPLGLNQMSHQTNYFIGDRYLTNIESNQEIWYYNLYPNIDLRYYMSGHGLKYDFIVHPGGIVDAIKVRASSNVIFDVHPSKVEIYSQTDPNRLIIVDNQLEVFQKDTTLIESRFMSIESNIYKFEISKYDPAQDLIIDPIWLGFSTFFGGNSMDEG